jgi:multicomponent Na+:H+ antiporter subunit E
MNRLRAVRRHPLMLIWLVAVWVGLWGSASAANVAGGLVLAVVLLAALPLPEGASAGRVSAAGVARFVVFFLGELVKATAIVVWQVLRPKAPLRQAVFRIEGVEGSDHLVTLIANSISLTPGTLTLEVDKARNVLYVHALDVDGPAGLEAARASVFRLERFAVAAIGSPADRARLARRAAGPPAPSGEDGSV